MVGGIKQRSMSVVRSSHSWERVRCREDEQDIKARGYNSDDERGTADRPDLDASPERSRLKRKADVEDAPAATLAGTGLESDDGGCLAFSDRGDSTYIPCRAAYWVWMLDLC